VESNDIAWKMAKSVSVLQLLPETPDNHAAVREADSGREIQIMQGSQQELHQMRQRLQPHVICNDTCDEHGCRYAFGSNDMPKQ
jgi:hypothetical protein